MLVLLALTAVASGGLGNHRGPEMGNSGGQEDWIPLPPAREEFTSPAGNYFFVISLQPKRSDPKPPKSIGELFQRTGDHIEKVWSRDLPHEYRPRFALVSDEGQVLLLDEWINVKSRYAVMVLDRGNQVVAQHHFDAVAVVLAVPVSEIVRMAKHGWWLQSRPRLDPSGTVVEVEAAGKTLAIRLSDGAFSLTRGA